MDKNEQQKMGENNGKLEQAIGLMLTIDFDYVMKLAETIKKNENNEVGDKIYENFTCMVDTLKAAMDLNQETAKLLRNMHMQKALAVFQVPGVETISLKLVGITHKVLIGVQSLTITAQLINIANKVNIAAGNRIQYSFSYLPIAQANEKCAKEGYERIWPPRESLIRCQRLTMPAKLIDLDKQ